MSCVDECLSDGDHTRFYSERQARARKLHKCSACPALIAVGELHYRVSAKWDDGISSYRYHSACYDLMREIATESRCGWQMDCDIDRCAEEIVTVGGWPTGVTTLAVAVIDRMVVADAGTAP